ncbi:hypothetical protein [Candidatus Frankia alpina]|uniref:Uncharacterized protein n=1 Tax=Candidatus Frankia alpina TaxID=2699483 RepID=A0A4S5ER76_9ACTN|nr:hypothetical protein [Candidatus Frankia alpina]THJ74935.1 hypothetical protein E7Y31_08440 [Candidatus Frankia alpina]
MTATQGRRRAGRDGAADAGCHLGRGGCDSEDGMVGAGAGAAGGVSAGVAVRAGPAGAGRGSTTGVTGAGVGGETVGRQWCAAVAAVSAVG